MCILISVKNFQNFVVVNLSIDLSIYNKRLILICTSAKEVVWLGALICLFILLARNLVCTGYQNTPLPDLHSPCLVVWVQNMVHHKAPVLSHWCIWHVGITQDPEDTIYSPCDECGSQSNHRMPSSLSPGHWQTFAAQEHHHRAVAAVIRGCLQIGSDR